MPDEQTTHVVYQGKHYALPGIMDPQEAFLRVQNLTGDGPKLSPGPGSTGFEDTSKEAAAIQARYPEPNLPQDILPKLAEFGSVGALFGQVPGLAGSLGALRGLPAVQKAATVAKGVAKAGAYGAGGYAVNSGLQAVGVPRGLSEMATAALGLGTKPGREMLRAGIGALTRGVAAPAVAEAAAATGATATTGAAEAAAARAAMAERALAIKEAESAARIANAQRIADARIAAIEARASGKTVRVPKAAVKPAPPAAPPTEGATALQPEPDFIDPSAVKVLPFPPAKGTVKPATNLGGAAKPGPTPTPPDKLEETLQATLDSLKAKKAGAVRGKSPVVDQALDTAEGMHQREATAGMTEAVADKRRRLGSQVVAREMGMGRHEVQSDAGTILNEALGEVSPVIPADRWKDIVTKMKSLPPEERTAYVARARGVKNMAQIENLRRTLETLGLLLPLGAVAGSVDQ